MNFAVIDIFFAIIVFLFVHSAASAGFVSELFSKLSFLLGLVCAILFYRYLSPYLIRFIESPSLRSALAFLMIFSVIYVAVRMLQTLLARFIKGDLIRGLNRSLGFFLGLAEGLIVVTAILVLLHIQPWFAVEPILRGSIFYSLLKSFVWESRAVIDSVLVSLCAGRGSLYV